jgi:cytochrome c oxidase assembly protein subunit 15
VELAAAHFIFDVTTQTSRVSHNPWLHRFAVLTAVATLILVCIGGLVTSHGVGMSVPDWPTSYGYNMFALPIRFWTGGIFYEHTHRLWATFVGVLVVALTRWLGGRQSRFSLAIIGLAEVLAGFGIFLLWPKLKPTGHFLTGIGGVVLLAALVWVRNERAERPLPALGWTAFWLVQFQGLLGGLRVVLLEDQIGIFHGALAQIFFVLLCVIALFTSRKWKNARPFAVSKALRVGAVVGTALIFLQLILGATMRHQHAGLAVSDFPLAHGKLWPDTDPASIQRYNEERIEISSVKPITAFQVELHMAHRVTALVILIVVGFCAGTAFRKFRWRSAPGKWSALWLALILTQVTLGAATVLTHKAADVATAHVLVGAVSLATGFILCLFCFRNFGFTESTPVLSANIDGKKSGKLMSAGSGAAHS